MISPASQLNNAGHVPDLLLPDFCQKSNIMPLPDGGIRVTSLAGTGPS